ncbi:MAG TPA: hypothetical protein PKD83_14605, partial [Ignavibacteria bacterium]|nr:hypothetical protein [Ignavibacteria bacterium]
MKSPKAVIIYLSISILFIITLSSCSEDVISPDTSQQYEIKVWDYSDNHYFLDTLYKQSFADYYNNLTINSHTDSFQVDEQSFEIWVQTEVTSIGYRRAGLHVNLPKLPSSGKYNDTLKSVPNPEQGIRLFGIVRKLDPSEYKLNKFPGYVSLKINLPENYFAGVAYKTPRTGEQFGTISTDSNSAPNDTLVLKMVKVQNLIPDNIIAWDLKLKNIYQLPVKPVSQSGFEFNISYYYDNSYKISLPGISTYLNTILKL